jgi:hypothetical protein
MAAIAAVLVLSTAPAYSQQVPDVPADPPVIQSEPAAPAPATEATPAPEASVATPAVPQPSASTEVVQPVPSRPAETAQAAPASRAPREAAAPSLAASPSPQSARRDVLTTPLARPAATPARQPGLDLVASDAAPTPLPSPAVAATDTHDDDAAWWTLGAGTLLFAGGLGALAFRRSRKRTGPARVDQAKDRAPAATVQPAVAAEAAIAVPEPVMASSAPRAATALTSSWPELEEMVAERPSPENPFLTRSKRLRRARYLLEHGMPRPLSAEAQRQPEPVREPQPQRKPQPAFSYGRAPVYPNWRPVTT